jgi:hypothetical protein
MAQPASTLTGNKLHVRLLTHQFGHCGHSFVERSLNEFAITETFFSLLTNMLEK